MLSTIAIQESSGGKSQAVFLARYWHNIGSTAHSSSFQSTARETSTARGKAWSMILTRGR
jgi:hypothetical protein